MSCLDAENILTIIDLRTGNWFFVLFQLLIGYMSIQLF